MTSKHPHALRTILLSLLPAAIYTQNYAWMTANTYVGIAFLFIWLLMIWSAWQLIEKNHVTERLLRLTEIAFFLLPISSIVFMFVVGARAVGGAQGDAQQAGAAIGTAIGGAFIVALAFVVGLIGGIIMHLITGSYDKKAEASGVKQPETLSNKSGIALSLIGVVVIAFVLGAAGAASGPASSSQTTATGSQASQAPVEPLLEVKTWKFYNQYGFVHMEGEVANISGQRLESVTAVATYYDKDGTFITSDDTLIEYNPLMPGQTSPFEVLTTYNPAIEKGIVTFKYLFGEKIPVRYADEKKK